MHPSHRSQLKEYSMGAKTPGLLCPTTAEPVDSGTLCRHRSDAPGTTGTYFDRDPAGTGRLAGKHDSETRLAENRDYLKNANVKAFIKAIAAAEGGDYNLKFGGVKGKKDDKWQFSDYTTHPGTGSNGKTTAAGMYQINKETWREMGAKMGLRDFSADTQDLLAVEILRTIHVVDKIVAGNIDGALSAASRRWAALPQGPGKAGRYDQPYMKYEEFVATYKRNGGTVV
jgi:muramidase (phage lysozyme)